MLSYIINGRHFTGNMLLHAIILQNRDGQTWKPNQNLDWTLNLKGNIWYVEH